MFRYLQKTYRSYSYDKQQLFQEPKGNEDFVLIDEMTTEAIAGTTLNEICDGNYIYPRKGAPSIHITT